MRKLIPRKEREKKAKRNQFIVGIVLVFLMLASTLGFALQGGLGQADPNQAGDSVIYNGFEFINNNGAWILGSYVFRYTPQQVSDIGTGLKPAQEYQGLPLYLYSESDSAGIEISVNMGQIAQRVQMACPQGEVCEDSSLPVKDCTDNFIIIKEADSSSIRQENNCVYIEGSEFELPALADQFLFKTLGIR
jgi:hypothetical protein